MFLAFSECRNATMWHFLLYIWKHVFFDICFMCLTGKIACILSTWSFAAPYFIFWTGYKSEKHLNQGPGQTWRHSPQLPGFWQESWRIRSRLHRWWKHHRPGVSSYVLFFLACAPWKRFWHFCAVQLRLTRSGGRSRYFFPGYGGLSSASTWEIFSGREGGPG